MRSFQEERSCPCQKNISEQLQVSTATSTSEAIPTMPSAFSTKQILSRSVHKIERSLPLFIYGSKIITNENFPSFTEVFEHELSFSQMYNFLKMHKEVAYSSDIPLSSCLCEVCENASLLAKGINSGCKSSDILSPTAHDLVKTHTYDSISKD